MMARPLQPVDDVDNIRPEIVTNNRQLRDLSAEAMAALELANEPPEIFQRGGRLVRIRRDESSSNFIEEVSSPALKSRLSEVADFVRVTPQGIANAFPTEILAKDLLARPKWNFPFLGGISEIPLILPGGSLVTQRGYDPQSRFFYEPPEDLVVPAIYKSPTRKDVARALDLLLEVVEDFPFDSDASKSNALAMMLTPLLRPAIAGPVPLAVINAPKAGTGKSLLADVVSLIASGGPATRMSPPNEDEEWRRTITAKLRSAPPLVLLDNLSGPLSSGVLAGALTSQTWEDRLIRSSEMLRLPNLTTWFVTGNNVRLGGDIARRCYHVRMDAASERPWQDRSFQHPDLPAWILSQRGELIGAALTLAKAWFNETCPEPVGVPMMGSFEQWRRVVGGVLLNAGVTSFLGNLDGMYEAADEDAVNWGRFFENCHAEFESHFATSAQIADWLRKVPHFLPDLPEEFGDDPTKGKFERRIGRALAGKAGAIYGGLRLERGVTSKHLNVVLWRVARV